MSGPINPQLDRLFREKILQVNRSLSQRSVVYSVVPSSKTQCPNCKWDAEARAGSGIYNGNGPKPFTTATCPVCRNVGQVGGEGNRIRLTATVRWGKPTKGANQFSRHGEIPDGHAQIKVPYAELSIVMRGEYFEVDGLRCVRVNPPLNRGLQSYVMTEFLVREDR